MREIVPASRGYEEGLEAGRKVAGSWYPSRLTKPEKWRAATIEAANICGAGKRDLNEILADLGRWKREDLLNFATDLHGRKLAAFPDLAGWRAKITPSAIFRYYYLPAEKRTLRRAIARVLYPCEVPVVEIRA